MMKKYNFIIGYEHKNREIESICLLKQELEKRGYSVLVYCTRDNRFKEYYKRYYAEVLLLPYAYCDETIYSSIYWSVRFNKLINLQWEQAVYRQQEDNPDSYMNPSGIGKKAVHLAWGKANERRLTQVAHIDQRNVKITGNMALDFLQDPLTKYYMTKEQMYEKYHIPTGSKVCLFIASFKTATLDEETLNYYCERYGEWRREQHKLALKTLMTILDWIKNALDTDPNLYFIYRPHPGERADLAEEIERNCDRFHVIRDLSVKQWILSVDRVYTWLSTTVVEAYFAHKNCHILYPCEMPEEMRGRLFDNMRPIRDYNTFLHSLNEEEPHFPIDINVMNDYYLNDGMSYIKVADVCEDVLKSSDYAIEKRALYKLYHMISSGFLERIWRFFWQLDWFYNLFWYWDKKLSLRNGFFVRKRMTKEYFQKLKSEEYMSEEEIRSICDRITACLGTE